MTEQRTLNESISLKGARVTDNIVHGVAVLGPKSPNGKGRDYTPEYMESAKPMYEGIAVTVNHPSKEDRKKGKNRGLLVKVGKLEGVEVVRESNGTARMTAQKMVLNPEYEHFGHLKWMAENTPEQLGLSHDVIASGHKDAKSGRFIAESCVKAFEVALVDGPGTNKSLFECLESKETFETHTEEGPIADKLAADIAKQNISKVVHSAERLMDQVLWNREATLPMVKTQLIAIAIDLQAELVKVKTTASTTEASEPLIDLKGNPEMEIKDLTLEELSESRPDLVELVQARAQESKEAKALREKDAAELAEYRKKAAVTEARNKVKEQLKESKLPEKAITEAFVSALTNVDEKTAAALIEERRAVYASGATIKSKGKKPFAKESAQESSKVSGGFSAYETTEELAEALLADPEEAGDEGFLFSSN